MSLPPLLARLGERPKIPEVFAYSITNQTARGQPPANEADVQSKDLGVDAVAAMHFDRVDGRSALLRPLPNDVVDDVLGEIVNIAIRDAGIVSDSQP